MFRKLVAIEPVSLVPWGEEELKQYAQEIVQYQDIPANNAEILRRIGDADAVLVSYTTRLEREVIEACPNVKYIGMCCSLYSEESANVDIACAREHGIQVLGVRDYGDRGVVEFAMSELIRFLHGFDRPMLGEIPLELTNLPVGIVGLGVTGTMIAEALQFMGANISYYSRSRKPEKEAQGFQFKPLKQLLSESKVVFLALNKNVILLHEEEFAALGQEKILFNTSIGPGHDPRALEAWLAQSGNYFVCDSQGALGDPTGELLSHPQVFCADISAGRTAQCFELLTRKVLDNIKTVLGQV